LAAVAVALYPHVPYDDYNNACDDNYDGNACGEMGFQHGYEEAVALAAEEEAGVFLSLQLQIYKQKRFPQPEGIMLLKERVCKI
jgi:hypothetical protein